MLRTLMLLTATTLVGACATTTTTDSAGSRETVDGITVNCSGPESGWVFCYRSAAQLCGNASYTVLKRNDDALAAGAAGGESRSMIVKCN